jgi:hypothetical protein
VISTIQPRYVWRAFALGLLVLAPASAVTLDELLADPKLTPKRFANYFERFDFEAHDEVQLPEVFLAQQKGDCDDYAVLADLVLRQKGYGTRLIHVRLVGRFAHAVCYVTEERAYLDFNNRIFYVNLEKSGPMIRDIADKAAESFQANWTTASEFTYDFKEDRKKFGVTVVKTDPREKDPDFGRPPPPSRRKP